MKPIEFFHDMDLHIYQMYTIPIIDEFVVPSKMVKLQDTRNWSSDDIILVDDG